MVPTAWSRLYSARGWLLTTLGNISVGERLLKSVANISSIAERQWWGKWEFDEGPLVTSDSSYPFPPEPIIFNTTHNHCSLLLPHCQVRDGPTSSPNTVFPCDLKSILAEWWFFEISYLTLSWLRLFIFGLRVFYWHLLFLSFDTLFLTHRTTFPRSDRSGRLVFHVLSSPSDPRSSLLILVCFGPQVTILMDYSYLLPNLPTPFISYHFLFRLAFLH